MARPTDLSHLPDPEPTAKRPAPPVPLAIVGLGCLFPRAHHGGAFWAAIKNGVDCVTEIPPTHWRPEDYYTPNQQAPDMTYARRGGFLSPLDFSPIEFGISPRDLDAIDTAQLLGLVAAQQALWDAGYTPEAKYDRSKVSVVIGVTGAQELVIPLGARLGHPKWRQALLDSGIDPQTTEEVVSRISESYVEWQENSFPGLLGNVVAGRIANRLDLGGTNCVVDAACASSLSAIHLAGMELATGRSDVAVTGGVDTFNDIFMYMCFSKTPALSPTGNSKPFDKDGDGTILGEGLGLVVLKRLADAERDGNRIYAVIRGLGSSSDGKGSAIYAPVAAGQMKALKRAYEEANISPATVELVEAHGTGTKVGDAVEVNALTQVYREARPEGSWCALGSVKSQIGHTKAAAGAAGLIKAALALHYKVLPPTLKVSQPLEQLQPGKSPFYVNTQKRPWLPSEDHPRRAAVSAFGFGGSNFHAVLEEYQPTKREIDWDGDCEILAFGGDSKKSLSEKLAKLNPSAPWGEIQKQAKESRERFDSKSPHRLLMVLERDSFPFAKTLATAKQLLNSPERFAHSPDGVYYGHGPASGTVGVLFPGQGSQYAGMLRDLACQFPKMQEVLEEGNRVFRQSEPFREVDRAGQPLTGPGAPFQGANEGSSHSEGVLQAQRGVAVLRAPLDETGTHDRPRADAPCLTDFIYPHPVFDAESRAEQERALRQTQIAQPAIGAVSLGALKVLESFGLEVGAYAGHSYGELPALCAAGVFDSRSLHHLSRLRGHLMNTQRGGDAGAMLAVHAPLNRIQEVLTESRLDLVIANKNAPNQTVLSGSTPAVEAGVKVLQAKQIRQTRLPVAAAFHSALVAEAARPFRGVLDSIAFSRASAPVFANTTAARYPEAPEEMRSLLAGQLSQPVEFVREVACMAREGVRTFVEVGPGATLSRLVDSILKEDPSFREWDAVSLDASQGRRSGMTDLAHLLARLSARGHSLNLKPWQAGREWNDPNRTGKPGVVALTGANHTKPRNPRPKKSPPPMPTPITQPPTPQRSPAPITQAPKPGRSAPVNEPTPPAPTGGLSHALQVTQQSLEAFQKLQEQTAQLHKQFLEQQESAQRTLQALVEQQQFVLHASLGGAPAALPAFAPPPPPARKPMPVAPPAPPPVAAPVPTPRPAPTPRSVVPPERMYVPPPPPIAPAGVSMGIDATLLEVVSEKTGYPVEMLNLDMTMDSDLGIDSIKRVEILSTLQDRLPDAPVVKPEHLGVLQTLRDVADFLGGGGDSPPTLVAPVALVAPVQPPGEVDATLLEVVSEKTGYPVEMLNLDMTMDSDLGIDSIKRVEILSTLQDRLPDAPIVKPEHLGTLLTLRDVGRFLRGKVEAAGSAEFPEPAEEEQELEIVEAIPAKPVDTYVPFDELLRQRRERTASVPDSSATEEMAVAEPEPTVVLEAIQAELEAAMTDPVVTSESHGEFEFDVVEPPRGGPRGHLLAEAPTRPEGELPMLPPPTEVVSRLILRAIPLHQTDGRQRLQLPKGGTVWIVADPSSLSVKVAQQFHSHGCKPQFIAWNDSPFVYDASNLVGMILLAPEGKLPEDFPLRAFRWVRHAGSFLKRSAQTSDVFLATVSNLDGAFGLERATANDPITGALAGMLKTAAREWPRVFCKAIDLDPQVARGSAHAIADEVLHAGPIEVGISALTRFELQTVPLAAKIRETEARLLAPEDGVVVTGGARGVTFETVLALAKVSPCRFVLLGRTPAPEELPDWLQNLSAEGEIKQAIAARLSIRTPRELTREYQRLLAQREITDNLKRLRETGAGAEYRSVDVQDRALLQAAIEAIRQERGPVRGIVHGAGVLADRKIEDLTDEQFSLVYATKVQSLQALLDATRDDPLKLLAVFSSSTARYGRVGQASYAAANEALNKIAQQQAHTRPDCRVVAVNWGPWDGGMVTPALKQLFASEGVACIPLQEGGEFFARELHSLDRAVEVVAIAKSDSLPVEPLPPPVAEPPKSEVKSGESLHLAFEHVLAIHDHPVLGAHVIDTRAVLPMALHLEFLAHGALLHHPHLTFVGCDRLRVLNGVHVEDHLPSSVRVFCGKPRRDGSLFHVPAELRGRRQGKEVLHSRAEILLSSMTLPQDRPEPPPKLEPMAFPLEAVYRDKLFHGPLLRCIDQVEGSSSAGFVGWVRTSPSPSDWIDRPVREKWLAEPQSLDGAFQMMILWTLQHRAAPSLPVFLGRYRQFVREFKVRGVQVRIRVTRGDGALVRSDIDFCASSGELLARINDYECVIDATLREAFRRNQLVGPYVG